MLNWKDYRQKVVKRAGELAELDEELVKGYRALAAASNKTRHLDAKTRELIALAVAVTTRCDGCIAAHVEAAIKAGTSREEISEALGVAIALNAGAAFVYTARTLDAYDDFKQD